METFVKTRESLRFCAQEQEEARICLLESMTIVSTNYGMTVQA